MAINDKQKKVKAMALLLQIVLMICLVVLIGWILDNYIGRLALGVWVIIVLFVNIESLKKLSK